jgi:dTDP-glucose 4,6-dehydratase
MKKRVLITGGAGFIGHHVIDLFLRETDWEIVSLDRLDYSGNLNRLDWVAQNYSPETRKRIKVVWHDLKAPISEITANLIGPVNFILHLAASSHVDRSIDDPMSFVMDNTIGTVNLLDYARTLPNLGRGPSGFQRLIYFSTDEIFGPAPGKTSYKERDRYNSTNPYSASKAAGEEFCVSYENTYNLPIYITHTMNVFGERQHPEKFIPMCIQRIRDGEKIFIHSDPTKTIPGSRHYIHARDVAEAMLFLLNMGETLQRIVSNPDETGAKCPKFNVVGKEEIDNVQLVNHIARAVGEKPNYELVDFHTSRPGHDLRYALDGSYMERLGWKPRFTLEERIKEVVDWSLTNPEWIEL